jgi:hypothetical protein
MEYLDVGTLSLNGHTVLLPSSLSLSGFAAKLTGLGLTVKNVPEALD